MALQKKSRNLADCGKEKKLIDTYITELGKKFISEDIYYYGGRK